MIQTQTPKIKAAVVTEAKWNLVVNAGQIARARKNKPEPVVREATSRVSHSSASCLMAQGLPVVATDVALDTVEAGLPCDWCIPNVFADVIPTAEELATATSLPARGNGEGAGTGTRRVNEPSEKQAAFVRSLWTERGLDADAEQRHMVTNGEWNRTSVSAKIDELLSAPRISAPAPATTDVPAGLEIFSRSNRYGGRCELCGGHVGDGAGRLAKRNGKFAVVHNDGECGETTEAPAPAEAPLADVPAGHYAIPSSGDNDLVFYRIDRPSEGDYAGRTFVKMIVGGHPDQNVRRANVPGILSRIAEYGVEAAATLYGTELGQCYRCNRHLTDELSRQLGIGPECRKHV
jgi:hypothetical protein